MSDYDFKTLDDKEFESLCVDLIGASLGVRIERFKAGKDGGVDGRFFSGNREEVILQFKHRPASSLDSLISSLKTDELPKIQKLKPNRYIIALSHRLSRTNKDSILSALNPFVLNANDIFGREDLNDILAENFEIERKHYKLWLCSSNTLQHLLNKGIFERSDFSLSEISDNVKKYVKTQNHEMAKKILDGLGVLLISGEPGVGKTTLAEHLSLEYVTNGFEYFKITNRIEDAERVIQPEIKQIFYYDDFLGRNYLEALDGKEESNICNFIRRISKDKNKRFVLTSRSTILNQAKAHFDVFEHENIRKNEYELNITKLTNIEKAKILYSHLWHSGIQSSYIDEIYTNKRYRNIILHPNFNPRIISFITDAARIDRIKPSDYWEHILASLKNPSDVWRNPFEVQIDDFCRALVFLVVVNAKGIPESELNLAYNRYIHSTHGAILKGNCEFLFNIRVLTGSLLTRKIDAKQPMNPEINLFNPSIGDFVLRRYSEDPFSIVNALISLRNENSIRTLDSLITSGLIQDAIGIKIAHNLFCQARDAEFMEYTSGWAISFSTLATKHSDHLASILFENAEFIEKIFADGIPRYFTEMANIVNILNSKRIIPEARALIFIDEAMNNSPMDDEIEELDRLLFQIDTFATGRDEVEIKLRDIVIGFVESNLSSLISENDIFSRLDRDDYPRARERATEMVQESLWKYSLHFDEDDIKSIVGKFDIQHALDDYLDSFRDDEYHRDEPAFRDIGLDEIDDLFQRDI